MNSRDTNKPFTYFCIVTKLIAFLLVVVVLCFVSCGYTNTCGITERSEEIFLKFYNYETNQLLVVDFDSVGVVFDNEEVFYAIDTTASILPIDVGGSTTGFILYTDSIDYDFKLVYHSELLIENDICNPVFRISALEATSEKVDSIAIKVLELTKLISPHVEIYF